MTAVLIPGLVFAQGSGATPKGKPFIEIQGQFVEVNQGIDDLQGDLDLLVGRVDGLEDRVAANETAISGLEAQNVILGQQITDLFDTTATNSADIAAAMGLIADLEADLVLLRADVVLNAEAIALNEAEILIQKDFVTQNTQGLQSLLQQVENNILIIAALQDEMAIVQNELATKQDILNGSCAPGTALTAIDPSGAITCQTSGGALGFAQFSVTQMGTIPAATLTFIRICFPLPSGAELCFSIPDFAPGEATVTATCPIATVQSGGGFDNPFGLIILSAQSTLTENPGALSFSVRAQNNANFPRTISARADCLRFD